MVRDAPSALLTMRVKSGRASSPLFYAARGGRSSNFPSRPSRRGRSAGQRHVLDAALRRRVLLRSRTRAGRRSIAAFFSGSSPPISPRAGLPGTRPWVSPLCEPVPVQRAPRRAVLMPPDRGPVASRVFACEAKPRAPHPAPPSERLATAPFDGPDNSAYSPIGI